MSHIDSEYMERAKLPFSLWTRLSLFAVGLGAQEIAHPLPAPRAQESSDVFRGKASDLAKRPLHLNGLIITINMENVIAGGIPGFYLQVENPSKEMAEFDPKSFIIQSFSGRQAIIVEILAFRSYGTLAIPSPIPIAPGAFAGRHFGFSGATQGLNPPLKVFLSGRLIAEILEK